MNINIRQGAQYQTLYLSDGIVRTFKNWDTIPFRGYVELHKDSVGEELKGEECQKVMIALDMGWRVFYHPQLLITFRKEDVLNVNS